MPAVDRAPAGDHAVAGDDGLVHAEIGRAVGDEHVVFFEAALDRAARRAARGRSACPCRAGRRCAVRRRRAAPPARRSSSSSRMSFTALLPLAPPALPEALPEPAARAATKFREIRNRIPARRPRNRLRTPPTPVPQAPRRSCQCAAHRPESAAAAQRRAEACPTIRPRAVDASLNRAARPSRILAPDLRSSASAWRCSSRPSSASPPPTSPHGGSQAYWILLAVGFGARPHPGLDPQPPRHRLGRAPCWTVATLDRRARSRWSSSTSSSPRAAQQRQLRPRQRRGAWRSAPSPAASTATGASSVIGAALGLATAAVAYCRATCGCLLRRWRCCARRVICLDRRDWRSRRGDRGGRHGARARAARASHGRSEVVGDADQRVEGAE